VSLTATVIKRIDAGENAKFFIDYYGRQWVELRGRVLFWRRERIELAGAQIEEIKRHVRARRKAMAH
jgi:hypothetical protein